MAKIRDSTARTVTRHVSPLRYPGGKGKVANYVKLLVAKNSLEGATYVEPYAGGASVALSLLAEGYVGHAHINDLNKGLYYFWAYALNDPESFCTRIMKTPLSVSEWKRQREVYADPAASEEDLGFAVFYLNRTNRSGIISRGGVIGGLEQLGKWKIDARFDRESLCARIRKVATYRAQITLTSVDALDIIRAQGDSEHSSKIFYLDPPYYIKGSGLYDNFYTHTDHAAVCESVKKIRSPWVVSYDAAPEILEMYADCDGFLYKLGYSASGASKGTEAMFFSSTLELPDVDSPAGITNTALEKAKKRAATSEALFDLE